MNKKLLALLFAVPGFCAAQSAFETYKVMGFAPSLDQVAVESKNVEGHDVALAITRMAVGMPMPKRHWSVQDEIILDNFALLKLVRRMFTSCTVLRNRSLLLILMPTKVIGKRSLWTTLPMQTRIG